MAGERLADLAVANLAAYLRASLPAALRVVETECGLGAGSLADPEAVLEAAMPDDPRSPVVEVFDRSASVDQTTGTGWDIWSINCDVTLSRTGNDDLAASEQAMRRYATALVRCLKADRTLGGRVQWPVMTTGYSTDASLRGKQIRYEFTVPVVVTVVDP